MSVFVNSKYNQVPRIHKYGFPVASYKQEVMACYLPAPIFPKNIKAIICYAKKHPVSEQE